MASTPAHTRCEQKRHATSVPRQVRKGMRVLLSLPAGMMLGRSQGDQEKAGRDWVPE